MTVSTVTTGPSTLLEIRNLTVRYRIDDGGFVTILEGIDLAISRGESVGILGESGAGKTSLALAIPGLLPKCAASSGAIEFCGQELLSLKESELRRLRGARIAFIPQEPAQALNPVICVGRQVADVVRAHCDVSYKRARMVAEEALVKVGLAPVDRIYAAYPHQLSGGQRQRVVIAQALVCEPDLLIADEPTSSLDAITQAEVLNLLRVLQVKHGFALLLISHDPGVMVEMVDRIVVLRHGRVVDQGTTEKMFTLATDGYARSLLSGITEQPHVQ